jgi:hypothetical protein
MPKYSSIVLRVLPIPPVSLENMILYIVLWHDILRSVEVNYGMANHTSESSQKGYRHSEEYNCAKFSLQMANGNNLALSTIIRICAMRLIRR